MKKAVIALIALAMLPVHSVQADIFGELGKLGKKVEKVGSKIGKATGLDNCDHKKDKDSSASEDMTVPGVDIRINYAERYGNGVLISYTIQNNNDTDYSQFWIYVNGSSRTGTDSEADFDCGQTMKVTNEYNRSDKMVRADSRRQGYLYIDRLPRNANSISELRIGGRSNVRRDKNLYGEYMYKFRNIPLKGFLESNRAGVYCTHPEIKVNYLGASYDRDKKLVTLEYTLTQTGDDDISAGFFNRDSSYAYDEAGNQYIVGSETASFNGSFKLTPNQPVRMRTYIGDVPANTKDFSKVVATFGAYGTPDLHVRFDNLNINN